MSHHSSITDAEKVAVPTPASRWTRKRLLIIGGVIFVVIALGVGLGVGLGLGLNQGGDDNDSNPISAPPASSPTANPEGVWKPTSGTTWNYQLGLKLTSPQNDGIAVWGIDLVDNGQDIISGLQSNGTKVICYFSAGSYENWRTDASKFQDSDLGNNLDGWPGERWLNTNSQNVRNIMLARLDIAKEKGCDGVDPDNVDGYNNNNGVGLTQADAVNYMLFLAEAAQQRNLSIGLKNAGDIIPDVLPYMQWSVNEQCVQFNECNTFQPFIEAGKPVFHVEYPKGDDVDNDQLVSTSTLSKYCNDPQASGFSTIIKNMKLDTFIQEC